MGKLLNILMQLFAFCFFSLVGAAESSPIQLSEELLHGVQENNLEEVEKMLDYGALIHLAKTSCGCSPIHIASKRGNEKIMQALLREQEKQKQMSIDEVNLQGKSPLWLSVERNNYRVSQLLINAGAGKKSTVSELEALCELAKQTENSKLIELICNMQNEKDNGSWAFSQYVDTVFSTKTIVTAALTFVAAGVFKSTPQIRMLLAGAFTTAYLWILNDISKVGSCGRDPQSGCKCSMVCSSVQALTGGGIEE